jgi:hypothetical protein
MSISKNEQMLKDKAGMAYVPPNETITMPARPSRVKFLIARILGKRANSIEQPTETSKGCEITGYWFNKVLYVTNMSEIPCQQ